MNLRNFISGLVAHVFFLSGDPASKRFLRKYRNFYGKHRFVNRRKSSKKLLLIVAGFKKELWPFTLARIAKFVPASLDVCLVIPGVVVPELEEVAERHSWSLMVTHANKLALAQNLAIKNHPSAEWIYKLDEDIFIGENYFSGLDECWDQVERENRFDVGILAPLLNVNGYSSRVLLDQLGRTEVFEERFGSAKQSCMKTPFWNNPLAAESLWELCNPFDEQTERIFRGKHEYSACPFRFSIGAFMMQRSFWDSMQGFTVARAAELGAEEEDLCATCNAQSRVIIVCHYVLAGHLSFGPQNQHMLQILPSRDDL
jgi:hypothetical protein